MSEPEAMKPPDQEVKAGQIWKNATGRVKVTHTTFDGSFPLVMYRVLEGDQEIGPELKTAYKTFCLEFVLVP